MKLAALGIEWTVRKILNHAYERYGQMTSLKIDRQTKTIQAELLLKGEPEPIRLTLSGYDVRKTPAGATLSVSDVTVSREWMQTLARELLQNKPLKIPPAAAAAIDLLL